MIVVATDAPLDARNRQRLAARAVFALARAPLTPTAAATSPSRSRRIPLSASPPPRAPNRAQSCRPTDNVSGLFEAVLDATEEAVDNSLLKATDVTANGRTIRAIPVDALQALLKKYGR